MHSIILAKRQTDKNVPELWRDAVVQTFDTHPNTLGFIMNQRVSNYSSTDISRMYGLEHTLPRSPVYCGGPVQTEKCTILHSTDYANSNTHQLNQHCAITFNNDICSAINQGKGPKHFKIMLGCCQWRDGQLDAEFMLNKWYDVAWSDLIWARYKRKDKMWRRFVDSMTHTDAQTFLASLSQ